MRLINVLIQEMSVFRSQKVTLIKYYLEAVAMHHLYCIIKMFACFKNGFVDAKGGFPVLARSSSQLAASACI
jgi:hypothetical protein